MKPKYEAKIDFNPYNDVYVHIYRNDRFWIQLYPLSSPYDWFGSLASARKAVEGFARETGLDVEVKVVRRNY